MHVKMSSVKWLPFWWVNVCLSNSLPLSHVFYNFNPHIPSSSFINYSMFYTAFVINATGKQKEINKAVQKSMAVTHPSWHIFLWILGNNNVSLLMVVLLAQVGAMPLCCQITRPIVISMAHFHGTRGPLGANVQIIPARTGYLLDQSHSMGPQFLAVPYWCGGIRQGNPISPALFMICVQASRVAAGHVCSQSWRNLVIWL